MRALAAAFLATTLLIGGSPTAAQAERFFLPLDQEGAWTAPDRQVHFAASLAIAASLRVEGRSRAESAAGAFAVGIAKEVYDAALKPRRLGRGASRKDLVADLIGAAAGVILIAVVDR